MLACWQSAGSLREPDLRRLQPSLDLQTGCPRVGQQGAPVFVAGVFSPPPWLIAAGGCCLDGVWRAPGGDILMDCRGTGSAEGGPPRRSGRHRAALAGAARGGHHLRHRRRPRPAVAAAHPEPGGPGHHHAALAGGRAPAVHSQNWVDVTRTHELM